MPARGSSNRTTKPTDQPIPEITDPAEQNLYDDIERLRSETGPGSCRKIVVHKKRADGSKWERCRQFASGDLDVDQLPVLFGGGDFTLELIDENNKYIRRFPVSFSTDVYPQSPIIASPASPATDGGVSPADAQPGSLASFIQEMRAETKAAQDRHMRFMETVVTAIIGGQKPPSLKDQVDQLVALKSLADSNPKPDSTLISDAIKTGLDLAGRARGESPSDDDDDQGGGSTMRVIERIIDKVLTQPRRPHPAPGPTAAAGGPEGGPLPPELQPYAWLKKFAPYLIGWSRENFSPERAANVILEFVTTDEHMAMLEQFVKMPANIRNPILVQLDGRLGNYQAFIDNLAAELVKKFDTEFSTDDEDVSDDRGSETGPAQSA